MIAITVTIAAFAQALSWMIAGILILVSLVIPLLVNIAPTGSQLTPHTTSKAPNLGHPVNAATNLQHKSEEKHSSSIHPSATKPETRSFPKQLAMKPPQPHASSQLESPPRPTPIKQGPNFNPTIATGDYMEYDVELEADKDFVGEVTADGLVNVYLLDEENLDNLDEGEEFWSEAGEESVENARVEFTAPSQGKWFFVIENADDRTITATVKLQKGTASTPA